MIFQVGTDLKTILKALYKGETAECSKGDAGDDVNLRMICLGADESSLLAVIDLVPEFLPAPRRAEPEDVVALDSRSRMCPPREGQKVLQSHAEMRN
ncbi:hypothetical protein PAAG_12281 [Paracoccidioides lutzii Pb01]|uniref:Uncharacterized protein n=1 Tax=Paracoccidioides lutzii (strain ATCC MYA-826 / Pb01) TaxID=502779 RepID=A0A0A2V4F1_PARBA|nr:hypothetical protein PAAG_12281 [Paracoccidioides lutzii Pb01]KGQ01030.1 hypothetical protein PAAG_12281 [Paracoccidioides lutzii Pb01]